jgi:hypothetical protein
MIIFLQFNISLFIRKFRFNRLLSLINTQISLSGLLPTSMHKRIIQLCSFIIIALYISHVVPKSLISIILNKTDNLACHFLVGTLHPEHDFVRVFVFFSVRDQDQIFRSLNYFHLQGSLTPLTCLVLLEQNFLMN